MIEAQQIVGDIPAWVRLGPEQTIDGEVVREVLGDWSHLNECDRPPRYVTELGRRERGPLWDRSDARPPVKSPHPGRDIAELRGIHSGRTAVLFNGASLGFHDLHRIRCPTVGMNRTHIGWPTYGGPQPTYLCVVDHVWLDNPNVRAHPKLINGSTHRGDHGYRVPRSFRMAPFSFDLARDGYVCPIPCTTGALALQFAAYAGFREIYCLGLDMEGPHFDGTRASAFISQARRHLKLMAPAIEERGIKVWVCGSPESACDAFPHALFEEVC